ncbi:hypothetical protein KP509_20G015900 [Ceratopteris richardii]|nr:hypothetical protein KP509_20G015900 [Ceratopteris richardii]
MEVPGEAHQSISCCCQHACDEVNSCCQIKETEETQNMQSVARFNAHAESTHLMQDVDMLSGGTIAGDDLEVSHDTLNKNKHSVVECIIGLVSSSNNGLHRKEEHHMPDSLLKNNTDASFGKPLCSLNDDRKTLVAGITEPISNEKDVIRKISSVCDEPAHGTQGLCRNFEESSKIIDSVKDLEGQLTNLVDKEKAIRNDFKGGITRLSIDDGVEGNTACSDGTTEVIDGITSMSTLSNVGSLHMKECHLTMVNVEHGASVSNMECSQSCATDTDGSHCVPSTMDIQNQEIEVKANQKRKKQPEFPSPVRRITRSSAKRKYGT